MRETLALCPWQISINGIPHFSATTHAQALGITQAIALRLPNAVIAYGAALAIGMRCDVSLFQAPRRKTL